MKKIMILFTLSSVLLSCNVNPSKEARIQTLEAEIQEISNKLIKIENDFQTLEVANDLLKARIEVLENL